MIRKVTTNHISYFLGTEHLRRTFKGITTYIYSHFPDRKVKNEDWKKPLGKDRAQWITCEIFIFFF